MSSDLNWLTVEEDSAMFCLCTGKRPLVRLLSICGVLLAAFAAYAGASEPSPGVLGVTLNDWEGRVFVKDVYVDGPAYTAGIRRGDRIIAVGHKAVNTAAELIEVLAEYKPNDRIELFASRDGWMKDLPVTLASKEDMAGKPLFSTTQTPPATAAPLATTPQATPRRSTSSQRTQPLVHPDPFHRKRYERW